jgi:transcriptional regulator with XRE-family HTH domain
MTPHNPNVGTFATPKRGATPESGSGNIPYMGNRLKQLREEKGWTAEEAANHFGLSRSGYVKLERGERRLSDGHIATAARVYGVGMGDVLGTSTLGPALTLGDVQPVFGGFVQAGKFLQVDEYFQQDVYEVPEFVLRQPAYSKVRQYSYQVRGDSLDAVGITDGMWIVAADAADFIDVYGEVESGEFVVVERTRYQGAERELTVKEIRFYRDRYELLPRSHNPEHQVIVVPHDKGANDDGIEVKIVGVLLTAYMDFRRKR